MTSVHLEPIDLAGRWAEELSELPEIVNPTLRWILHGFDDNFDEKLNQLKKTWSIKVRTYYRDLLSLNTRKSPIQVIYKLDDHGAFIRIVEDLYPDLDFAEFVALRRFVREVAKVEAFYTDDFARAQLLKSSDYARGRLKDYNLDEIIRRLFDFYQRSPDADIFGRYYFQNHTIEIYLIPCIVFSMLIEEDFLDMAIGTLAHELAHGFHHVGADKDGAVWETIQHVEPALREGLAEFYTREFARRITGDRPSVLRTFEKTANYLSEEYRRYEKWGEEFGLEVVYQAFIEARRNDIREFEEFQRSLGLAKSRLEGYRI